MSRSRYKTDDAYRESRTKELAARKRKRDETNLKTISEAKMYLYSSIPTEEECPTSAYKHKSDKKMVMHNYCEVIGERYRKELKRAWNREKQKEHGDMIIVMTTLVNYSRKRVAYKVELTARGAFQCRQWLKDKWEEILKLDNKRLCNET